MRAKMRFTATPYVTTRTSVSKPKRRYASIATARISCCALSRRMDPFFFFSWRCLRERCRDPPQRRMPAQGDAHADPAALLLLLLSYFCFDLRGCPCAFAVSQPPHRPGEAREAAGKPQGLKRRKA
ncbi:uncharacterized protein Tco025E_08979 [Trypanosoma conorhini]|uniref:Uncharacterized protein n=1 Tax=Trypanosoma conorhini TaxID=83891 RepID=A0A422N252_9TRYP|nr:uncharacterized protein Tco025E_08979 [Trypanosoma conorhini]RNE99531.1 hypothetical protein Tco025E_08979 [Trypanosoma conorhini]